MSGHKAWRVIDQSYNISLLLVSIVSLLLSHLILCLHEPFWREIFSSSRHSYEFNDDTLRNQTRRPNLQHIRGFILVNLLNQSLCHLLDGCFQISCFVLALASSKPRDETLSNQKRWPNLYIIVRAENDDICINCTRGAKLVNFLKAFHCIQFFVELLYRILGAFSVTIKLGVHSTTFIHVYDYRGEIYLDN